MIGSKFNYTPKPFVGFGGSTTNSSGGVRTVQAPGRSEDSSENSVSLTKLNLNNSNSISNINNFSNINHNSSSASERSLSPHDTSQRSVSPRAQYSPRSRLSCGSIGSDLSDYESLQIGGTGISLNKENARNFLRMTLERENSQTDQQSPQPSLQNVSLNNYFNRGSSENIAQCNSPNKSIDRNQNITSILSPRKFSLNLNEGSRHHPTIRKFSLHNSHDNLRKLSINSNDSNSSYSSGNRKFGSQGEMFSPRKSDVSKLSGIKLKFKDKIRYLMANVNLQKNLE